MPTTNRNGLLEFVALAAGVIAIATVVWFGPLVIEHVTVTPRGYYPNASPVKVRSDELARARILKQDESVGYRFLPILPEQCRAGLLAVVGRVCILTGFAPPLERAVWLPYTTPSTKASSLFTVRAIIRRTRFSSTLLQLDPDDCILSIQVNGKDLREVRKDALSTRCRGSSYVVDLSRRLFLGDNPVTINLMDRGGQYGINLTTQLSWLHVLMLNVALLTVAMAVCSLASPRLSRETLAAIRRYSAVGSTAIAAVAAPLVMNLIEGKWSSMALQDHLASHLPPSCVIYLPIPIAFLLWLRVVDRRHSIPLRFGPVASALAASAFVVAPELSAGSITRESVSAVAIFASLFVLAPFGECLRRAVRQPRPTLVAGVGALAAIAYYNLIDAVWSGMCGWTTLAVEMVLETIGAHVKVGAGGWQGRSFVIDSRYFSVEVFPGCNGLEGIFLFVFLLSVLTLWEWQSLGRGNGFVAYMAGACFMFAVNVLRISAFFLLGYWAHNPDAGPWVQSLTGYPLFLFHSNAGLILYLAAFLVFLAVQVRITATNHASRVTLREGDCRGVNGIKRGRVATRSGRLPNGLVG